MKTFYLGTHMFHWLKFATMPLFISYRQLRKGVVLPRANCRWVLDSGGFSELSIYGKWTISPKEYARAVRRFSNEICRLDWAVVQDWMCETKILRMTGLSIKKHQRLTIESYQRLNDLAPDILWVPVLQGRTYNDYIRHWEMYEKANINLLKLYVVGIGSICRRQGTKEVSSIVRRLSRKGLRLHGFGVKTLGFERSHSFFQSSDSMAWSFTARRERIHLSGCTHKYCNNCYKYASWWYFKLMWKLKKLKELELGNL